MRVESVEYIASTDEVVYDLEVEGTHNYLVSKDGVVVHNCGVGSIGAPGVLNGFSAPVSEIEVIRSTRTVEDWEFGNRGRETNLERHDVDTAGRRTWTLSVGDSAEAWAKALGKILAMKKPVDRIVLDFGEIRASGIRLKGYGWISSGDGPISRAFEAICRLLSDRAGELLTRINMLDIENHIGTTLSSRRSAEIILCPFGDPEWEEFALAKRDSWSTGNIQRAQSNNSLVFDRKPSKAELFGIFHLMQMAGGSEPGFVNGENARRRAPWWAGTNPCAEIALGDKSFCNLCTTDLGKFNGDLPGLHRAIYIIARANYRQTCVNLDDGVLQRSWHELNEFLRLMGVSLTGFVRWEHQRSGEHLKKLSEVAHAGAYSMADELGLPRPKGVTTQKPEGTQSKLMDTTEGGTKPMGKYIINRIRFSSHDPIVTKLEAAGYDVMVDPYDDTGRLIAFPVCYEDVEFTEVTLPNGRVVEVNTESAVDQLERYKLIMDNFIPHHNASNTISYSPEEVPEIVDWIYTNWDSYVGVSFLYRNDPTKTAEDLGYPYLPQTVCTKEEFDAYVSRLLPVDLDHTNSFEEIQTEECSGGACPVR